MRHRCACGELVSFTGHHCRLAVVIPISAHMSVDDAAKLLSETLAKLGLTKTIVLQVPRRTEPWADSEAKLKEMVDNIPPPSFVREMLGACPECGAAQFNDNMVAHALGCSRGGPFKHGHAALDNIADDVELSDTMRELIEDIDPLNSDAVRSAENAYAEMCIERERVSSEECDEPES